MSGWPVHRPSSCLIGQLINALFSSWEAPQHVSSPIHGISHCFGLRYFGKEELFYFKCTAICHQSNQIPRYMILGQRLLKNDHSNLGNKTESFRCALLQLFCRKIIIKITICVDWHSWMKVIAMDGVIWLRFLVNVCNKGMKSIWALCWTADNSMHIQWSITKTVIYDTFLESRGLALSFVHVKLFIKAISNKDESYISVHSDLSRLILVRPSSEIFQVRKICVRYVWMHLEP